MKTLIYKSKPYNLTPKGIENAMRIFNSLERVSNSIKRSRHEIRKA